MSNGKTEQYDSPRIRQLVEEMETGKDDALDCFWQEVKAAGIPFIEPCIDKENTVDENHDWVTFLYEGDSETESVSLRATMGNFGQGEDNYFIKRLPKSNVWYWTTKLRRDVRVQYWLCQNDPLPSREELDTDEKYNKYYQYILQTDRENPKVIHYYADPDDPDETDRSFSVFEGRNAAPLRYVNEQEGIPKGELKTIQFASKFLGDTRKNWIYTPHNFDVNRREAYPFLLLWDGYRSIAGKPFVTLDNLTAAGKIPPTVCFIFNNYHRNCANELPPDRTLVDTFAQELIPYLQEHYHISDKPEQNIISGASFGGMQAAWHALNNPQIFGNVLSQSGGFWWNPNNSETGWLIRQFVEHDRVPIKFYMNVGDLETQYLGGRGPNLGLNRHMRDVLRAKGYPVHYEEYSGGHDPIWWGQGFADGLIALHEMNNGA
jgi:enterochelin esterase-like enzyme